jgi:hypothetical protein
MMSIMIKRVPAVMRESREVWDRGKHRRPSLKKHEFKPKGEMNS